jgi:hypothetical protein
MTIMREAGPAACAGALAAAPATPPKGTARTNERAKSNVAKRYGEGRFIPGLLLFGFWHLDFGLGLRSREAIYPRDAHRYGEQFYSRSGRGA